MNYELLKKLKEAGFKFTKYPKYKSEVPLERYAKAIHFETGELFEEPTLSELIEACGEEFMLTNECGKWEAWSGIDNKYAPIRMGESGAKFECTGSTPEEAVANLWIELNKK